MKIQAIEELLISHKRTNLQKQLFPTESNQSIVAELQLLSIQTINLKVIVKKTIKNTVH
jgi:hypothetical protein